MWAFQRGAWQLLQAVDVLLAAVVQLVCAEDVFWRLQTLSPSLCIGGRVACVILALPPISSQPDPHQLGFSEVFKEEGMELWNILLAWELL